MSFRLRARVPRLLGILGEREGDVSGSVLALVAVTWLPMALLALGQRIVTGHFPPVVLRFEPHVRFLLTVPLVLMAGLVIRERIERCFRELLEAGYVPAKQRSRCEELVATAGRRRGSSVVVLTLALFAIASLGIQGPILDDSSWAARWAHFVGLPIFRFVVLRELWHWLVWALFLADVSQLDLALVASHPDLGGGLGFLILPSEAFSVISFALAALISAQRASDLALLGVRLSVREANQLVAFAALMTLLALAPFLPFTGLLIDLRKRARLHWGAFIRNACATYEEKWVAPGRDRTDPQPGQEVVQSLADMSRVFESVDRTRPFPFSPQLVVLNALAAFIPMLPVYLTQVSVDVLAPRLLKLL
jgi:hypothetical protein